MAEIFTLLEKGAYGFVCYYVFTNFVYLALFFFAFFSIRRIFRLNPLIENIKENASLLAPPISIIAPAYNEERTIGESVQSFLMLHYPQFEVLIINDGSKDKTLEVLKEKFQLETTSLFFDNQLSRSKILGMYRSKFYPHLKVIDKENGGKADSINVGIGFAQHELVCSVDSDSILEADALLRVVVPFVEDPQHTVAAGGTVRPVNGSVVQYGRVVEPRLPKNILALIQIVEYLRAFMFGRLGWAFLKSTLVISGAFGIFKKRAVIEVGGYLEKSVGEDMELVMRLRRHYENQGERVNIAFVPDPVCWTEVPEKWRMLARQRNRWQRGLADSLFRHYQLLFRWRHGCVGFFALPYFFIVELFGPVVEVFSYTFLILGTCLGVIRSDFLFLLLLVDVIYGMLLSAGAVLLEETAYRKYPKIRQLLALIFISVLENIGYRQWNSFHRLVGLLMFFAGNKKWNPLARTGFKTAS